MACCRPDRGLEASFLGLRASFGDGMAPKEGGKDARTLDIKPVAIKPVDISPLGLLVSWEWWRCFFPSPDPCGLVAGVGLSVARSNVLPDKGRYLRKERNLAAAGSGSGNGGGGGGQSRLRVLQASGSWGFFWPSFVQWKTCFFLTFPGELGTRIF